MSEYYTEDIEGIPIAVTVKLFEQHLPRWAAIGLAGWFRLRSKIGWPLQPQFAFRWNSHITWREREEMPAQALSHWAPYLEQLDDIGFDVLGWIKSDTIGAKEEANVFLLKEAGNTMATVLWTLTGNVEEVLLSFTSYRPDGTEIMTIGVPDEQRILLESLVPDYVEATAESKSMSVSDLWQRHNRRPELASAMMFTPDELRRHYQQQRIRFFAHACQRGLIRPLLAREVEGLRRRCRRLLQPSLR